MSGLATETWSPTERSQIGRSLTRSRQFTLRNRTKRTLPLAERQYCRPNRTSTELMLVGWCWFEFQVWRAAGTVVLDLAASSRRLRCI